MKIRINTQKFENSNGRKPSGGGELTPWAFQIGTEVKYFQGKFSVAKAAALEASKSNKEIFEIVVLP